MNEETTEDSRSEVIAAPENPHSLGKQVTGLVISTALVVVVLGIGGVLVALAGIFTFLDAWKSGIYKKPEKRAATNNSPMGWGVGMMWLWFIAYPIYLFKRNALRTKDGPMAFWILLHVISGLFLLLAALQVFVAMSGGAA